MPCTHLCVYCVYVVRYPNAHGNKPYRTNKTVNGISESSRTKNIQKTQKQQPKKN